MPFNTGGGADEDSPLSAICPNSPCELKNDIAQADGSSAITSDGEIVAAGVYAQLQAFAWHQRRCSDENAAEQHRPRRVDHPTCGGSFSEGPVATGERDMP